MTIYPGLVLSPPSWLSRLAPHRGTITADSASTKALHAAAVRAVGPSAVDWGVALGMQTAERIVRDVPNFDVGDESAEVLRMGVESSILLILMLLAGLDVDAPMTDETRACVADFVRREITLDSMLRSIQLGHAVIAREFLHACETCADPGDKVEEIQFLSSYLFEFFEDFTAEMTAAYQLEISRRGNRETAAKLRIVTGILESPPADPIPVSARLGYELAGVHLGLVAWAAPRTADAPPLDLAATVSGILREMRCTRTLITPISDTVLWAWGAVASGPEAVARFETIEPPHGVRAVLGSPAPGVEGFRRTHRDAIAAYKLLLTVPIESHAVAYSSVDMLSLLMTDRERAVDFARGELGRLGASTAQALELRRTLAVFLEEQGGMQATAQRLFVSRNTVAYRIRKAEDMLGRPVTVRSQQLHAALAIAATLSSSS